MLTRAMIRAAHQALLNAENNYWEEYPTDVDMGARWTGHQWNMVRHMVELHYLDELVYHLTHNLKETHIRKEILHVLHQSAPQFCQELNL